MAKIAYRTLNLCGLATFDIIVQVASTPISIHLIIVVVVFFDGQVNKNKGLKLYSNGKVASSI